MCVQSTVKVLQSSRTHFRSIAVVKCVFDHQPLEHLNGDLTDLSELLKGAAHLPHQQPHQEVVSTEVICQRVVQLKICGGHQKRQDAENKRNKNYMDVKCVIYLGTFEFCLFQKA